MLAIGNANELIERVWQGLGCRVTLPADWEDFFQLQGIISSDFADRRRFPRMYFRAKAVIRHADAYWGVYTRDISRGGLAFYHAAQLFPGDRGRIWLPTGFSHDLEIARCRRESEACYECGATFVTDSTEQ